MKLLSPAEISESSTKAEQPGSVIKILDGAIRAIADVGTRRLSMSDISDASGVSRGTLYRYFSSKDEVLAAVSEFVCAGFENGIRSVGNGIADPIERLRAVMRFHAEFTRERSPQRIFEVEPAFHLDFFRSHFERHMAALSDALDPVLDYLESQLRMTINRSGFVETLLRLQLSTLIVPASSAWEEQWNQAPDALQTWALKLAGQQGRKTT